MVIVRIDTETIRKNPTAGNTVFRAQGSRELSFTCRAGDLPAWLIDGKNMDILKEDHGKNGKIECLVRNPDLYEDLIKEKRLDIHYQNNSQEFYGMPEPAYFYKFHNPVLRCSECNSLIHSNDILVEHTDDDDWIEYEQCPNCAGIDTFVQRVFEDINDVIKKNPELK